MERYAVQYAEFHILHISYTYALPTLLMSILICIAGIVIIVQIAIGIALV